MDRREAYERRVWRLAFLLTGGHEAACARIVAAVLDAQPDVRRLDPARLDRLVVLSARRRRVAPPSPPPDAPPGQTLLAAAGRMPRQMLEAFLLIRIDGLDLMPAAKAMDCSKTATQRHLDRANEAMAEAFGDRLPEMIDALRAAADNLAPGPALRAHRERLRRRKRLRLALLVLGISAAVLAGALIAATFTRGTGF